MPSGGFPSKIGIICDNFEMVRGRT